ncbi:Hypothetical predicted protein [Mytilus galloprovincialis]|uniref:Uncharacterized protein n=1 Tax=Mytilus galloprovincialis TaxID=29158 RepID=A0A8B6CB32_MYTGA|nr:Hypothetical predicted protein [Mytilus galloprovincialis]
MAEKMVKRNLKEDDVLISKSNKEDDVLSMIDAELDISSSKKTDKVNEMYDNEYDDENDDLDLEPQAKKYRSDGNNNDVQDTIKDSEQSVEKSRFATMSKKFKQKELTGENIDETLAENITYLFRNGMHESQYNEMIKDELNPRPVNCDGLVIVKTNQLIWDLISPFAQTCEKKMQNKERSFVKAAVLLSKTVNNIEKTDNEANEFRESQPYTTFLFEDDVSKVAKDIEDCSKISNRIHFGRGSSRSRGRFGRGGRGRFGRGRGRGCGICRGLMKAVHLKILPVPAMTLEQKTFSEEGVQEVSEKCK